MSLLGPLSMPRHTLKNHNTPRDDAIRLSAAFDIVWQALNARVGDNDVVTVRLKSLIAMIASRRPNLQPADLAKIALRTFDTPHDHALATAEAARCAHD